MAIRSGWFICRRLSEVWTDSLKLPEGQFRFQFVEGACLRESNQRHQFLVLGRIEEFLVLSKFKHPLIEGGIEDISGDPS